MEYRVDESDEKFIWEWRVIPLEAQTTVEVECLTRVGLGKGVGIASGKGGLVDASCGFAGFVRNLITSSQQVNSGLVGRVHGRGVTTAVAKAWAREEEEVRRWHNRMIREAKT